MLISQFARAAGLSTDTVRFYIRRGLLSPDTNGKGGANPYQVFSPDHLRMAKFIRIAQSLGFSLKDIAALSEERRRGAVTHERELEILETQLRELEIKAGELEVMQRYLRAKIAWTRGGFKGAAPDFDLYAAELDAKRLARA